MKTYKVIKIMEQDFGCEERPSNQEYCVDAILEDTEIHERLTISVSDAELYEKNIDVGSSVYYDGKDISLAH